MIYNVPLPLIPDGLQNRAAALRHIDRSGETLWVRCPDADDIKAALLKELDICTQRVLEETAALRRMSGDTISLAPRPPAATAAAPSVKQSIDIDASPWAAWRKPCYAFVFYGLKDGTAWVLFPHKDGRSVMAPYPAAFDGWDEAMPAYIRTVVHDLGCYVVTDQARTMIYLGGLSRLVRTPSNWSEVLKLPRPPRSS